MFALIRYQYATIVTLFHRRLTALASISNRFRGLHISPCLVRLERKFGNDFGLAPFHPGQFRSYGYEEATMDPYSWKFGPYTMSSHGGWPIGVIGRRRTRLGSGSAFRRASWTFIMRQCLGHRFCSELLFGTSYGRGNIILKTRQY